MAFSLQYYKIPRQNIIFHVQSQKMNYTQYIRPHCYFVYNYKPFGAAITFLGEVCLFFI
jgi:hypothetical protein